MKQIIFLMSIIFFMNSVFAEEVNDTTATTDTVKAWTRGSEGNISFSQIAFSDWAAGGKNSLATSGIFNFYLNYAKNNQAWDNNLNFGYGIMRLDGNDYKKSDDKIQIETKYGLRASKKWFYSAAISFKTQFNDGFKYKDDTKTKVSDFFAPAYLTYSLGMDYKPHKNLSILLSPATGKTTFVYNDSLSNAGAYGVDVGKNIKTEVGSYIKMQFKTDILKNIELKSNLDLFSSFTNNPKNIDINWEAYITMKVNKYISTNIQTHLIYDDDINIEYKEGKSGPHLQFKELFGVGFTYKI